VSQSSIPQMSAISDLGDHLKEIKLQLDFLTTIDKVREPEFFNAAVDRVIKNVNKLKSGEVKVSTTMNKVVANDPSGGAWSKPVEPKIKAKKTYDPKTIATGYYVNFHAGTYHWLSEWRPQSSILVKDSSVAVKMRVDNGKPELNFRVGTSIYRWYPILETDQAVDCFDEDGGTISMKFKLVPNITADNI
jgi:hypothetical protein